MLLANSDRATNRQGSKSDLPVNPTGTQLSKKKFCFYHFLYLKVLERKRKKKGNVMAHYISSYQYTFVYLQCILHKLDI